jgi:subtilisin family serine protease
MSEQGTDEVVARRDVLKGLAGAGAVGTGVVGTDRGFASGLDGDRYLVGIDPDASKAGEATALAKTSALSLHREINLGDVRDVIVGRYDAERREQLSTHPAVAYVERERYFEPLTTSVDPEPDDYGAYPWGIERIGANTAHDSGYTGAGSDVAIIDTGITPSHYALGDNVGTGKAFGDSSCVEQDRQYNTVTCDQSWDDDQYHGTHVAGTAGAADAAVRPEVQATNVLVSETADRDVVTGQKVRDDSLGVGANVVTVEGDNVIINEGNVETESGANVETEFGVDVIESENGHTVADEGAAGYTLFSDGNTILSYTDGGDTIVNVQTADGTDVVPENVPDGAVERIAGVAPEATLHAANVFEWTEQNGEWVLLAPSSNTADAIRWATDQGYDVVNASLGGPTGSSAIKDALEYATEQHNVVFVAAAGNGGDSCDNDDCVGYPAAHPEAIAVASTNLNDEVASYSSRGPEVEVAAPGSNVLSTVPKHVKREDQRAELGYWLLNGTSMASPHVAGLAALVKTHTDLTDNTKIRERIAQTTEDIGGSDVETGNGLIDARLLAVETGAATEIGQRTATLQGEVSELGVSDAVSVAFEYGPVHGGEERRETPPQVVEQPQPITVEVSDLMQDTTYEFRLKASAESESDTGDISQFETALEPVDRATVDTTAPDSATFSQWGEGYRIRAAGQTPWDRPRDRHGYGALYEVVEGDVVVQTSIEGLYGDHDVRMAGIVVSNDLLGHGGVDGDLLLAAEPDAGVSLVAYDATERRYETVAGDSVELPGDIRLTKTGKSFTAAVRASTETEWKTLGTVARSGAEPTQEIGLFATGGHDTSRAIADFGPFQTGETGISLLPAEWTLPPDRTARFDLVVENANRGVQSYTADVAVSDVGVGRIDEITLTGEPVESTTDIRKDGSRATLAASLGESPHGSGDVTIAEVTVETQDDGYAEVTIPEAAVVGVETAVPYDITATQAADITVEGESGPPPVIGDDPPQDVDGDGLYEDINGDGRFSLSDVSALFEIRRREVVKNNAEFFNFDRSEAAKVTLQDVVALSEKLTGSDAEAAAILGVDPEAVRDGTVDPGDVSIRESSGSNDELQR